MHRSAVVPFAWQVIGASLLLACSVPPALGAQERGIDTLRYELTPVALLTPTDSTRDIRVRVSFRPRADGQPTPLRLPSAWAGWSDLHRSIVGLEAASPNVVVEPTDNPAIWLARSSSAGEVAIGYRVHQDWAGPIRRPHYFRAIAQPDVAVINGQNALVIPDLASDAKVAVVVDWRGLPDGWRAATSFGAGAHSVGMVTEPELRDALFVAGAFRWRDTTVNGTPLTIAMFGNARVPDSMVVRMSASVLEAERAFWSERTSAPYLVVRVPVQSGLGGTAFTNATAMYSDSASRPEGFGQTLAHEMFHAWLGRRLTIAGPEGVGKWFTEGFTDFYADRFALALGIIDRDEFLVRVNRAIRDYYMSPVRNAPSDSVAKSYWTDAAMSRLPYQQGYLIAGYLDAKARESSGGTSTLDSALARLLRLPRDGNAVTTDDIIAAFPAAAVTAVRRALAELVRDGGTVPVLAGGFDRCATVENRGLYLFDLGFDNAASTRDRRVSGVRAGSAADSAGLRNGQVLRAWSWNSGDTDRPVTLTVADSGATSRKVSYLARGQKMEIPQVVGGCRSLSR